MAQTRQNESMFVWDRIKSPEELESLRMGAMESFLQDYDGGRRGRYIPAELPDLPFREDSFDLALCSHFLFLYSDQLSLAFHEHAVLAMCRVAREVRVFPLLNYNSEPCPFLDPLKESLVRMGYAVNVETVRYEFQRGGNKMLRVSGR